MTTLRQQMTQDIQIAGLSERTREAYLRAVWQLADHYGQARDRLSEQHTGDFFLVLENKFAPASLKMAVSGVECRFRIGSGFLFRNWLLVRRKRRNPLPTALGVRDRHLVIQNAEKPWANDVSDAASDLLNAPHPDGHIGDDLTDLGARRRRTPLYLARCSYVRR
jgi:hypothetical protein